MKKLLLFTFLCHQSLAQLYVGTGVSIHMQSGALLSVEGLTLLPSANLDISNTTITVSHTPLAGPGGESIKRVYEVSGPVTFSGTLGIVYHEEELNGNGESSLKLAIRNTPSSSFTVSDNTVVNETDNYLTAAFMTAANLQGQITAFTTGSLPVTWISFEVRRENMQALLSWVTGAEVNTAYFAVERSTDGKYFTEAGRVKATGTSPGHPATYRFPESHYTGGTFYYRIRSVDHDGSTDVTAIRSVNIPASAELVAFPNPFRDKVSVQGLKGAGVVKVYDRLGRLVMERAVKSTVADIDLSGEAGGYYLIVAELNGNVYFSKGLLKE